MMPRLAALSMAEINARIRLGSGFSPLSAPFCRVRNRFKAVRFRRERLTVCRALLAADFVFAMWKMLGPGRSRAEAELSSCSRALLARVIVAKVGDPG